MKFPIFYLTVFALCKITVSQNQQQLQNNNLSSRNSFPLLRPQQSVYLPTVSNTPRTSPRFPTLLSKFQKVLKFSRSFYSKNSLLLTKKIPQLQLLRAPTEPIINLEETTQRFLPFAASGSCSDGKVYQITNPSDLLNHQTELECIFASGLSPTKVPTGVWFTKMLSLLNTRLFNRGSNHLWKGLLIENITCEGKRIHIGFNNIFGRPLAPAIFTLGNYNKYPLAAGEYENGKMSIIGDYGQDFRLACPDYKQIVQQNSQELPVRRQFLGNEPIVGQQLVDVVRLVGKQRDGGNIFMGKTFMKDSFRSNAPTVTIAYWSAVNYDAEVNPDFMPTESLPRSEASFQYSHPGIIDFMARVMPIDNLFVTPLDTVGNLMRGARSFTRNAFQYGQEFVHGIRNARGDNIEFRNKFNLNNASVVNI